MSDQELDMNLKEKSHLAALHAQEALLRQPKYLYKPIPIEKDERFI